MSGGSGGQGVWAVGAVLAVAFVLAWAVASLGWPFGLDQGIFAWVGDTILRGGWPYRDAWEIKGPATHFLYALAQALFGRDVWGLRVLDLGLLAASAAAAYGWTARSVGAGGPGGAGAAEGERSARIAGGIAAFAWICLYASGGHWHVSQPDGWAAMAWLGAAWCLARPAPGLARSAGAGALCALAGLLKPLFAPFLGLLWVTLRLQARRRPGADNPGRLRDGEVRVALASLLGLLGVFAAVGVAFAVAGALGELVEVQLVFNPSLHPTAYRGLEAGPVFLSLAGGLAQPGVGAAVMLGAVGAAIGWRRSPADGVLLVGWWLAGAGLVVVQNQYFAYHYWPWLAGCALGIGQVAGAAQRAETTAGRWVLGAALAGALCLAARGPVAQVQAAVAVWREGDPASAQAYRDGFGMGSYGFGAMERIATHIAARTAPDDPILVWGFESGLYFLADRPASTRFGFLYPLVRGGGSPLEARYLDEFVSSLATNPPVYVVAFDQSYDEAALPEANRRALRAWGALLERCYVRDASLAGARVRAWGLAPDGRAGCPARPSSN